MGDNVTRLPNAVLPVTRSAGVIEDLKRLLEKAERGEIVALAYATVGPERSLVDGWAGEHDTRDRLGMSIMLLHHRYAACVWAGKEGG